MKKRSKYTRVGHLTAGMQRALATGGARVARGPGGSVVLVIGKVAVGLSIEDADNLGLALQAEAEEVRRLAREAAESPPASPPPSLSTPST